MATRIRLRRMGARKRPFYRVVVADQRSPRDGRFIEAIGKYHPLDDPSLIEIDGDKALDWLRKGAQPSDSVRTLFAKVGIWERFVAERPSAAVREHPAGAKTRARWEASAASASAPPPAGEAERPPAESPAAEEPAAEVEQPPAEEPTAETESPAAEEPTAETEQPSAAEEQSEGS